MLGCGAILTGLLSLLMFFGGIFFVGSSSTVESQPSIVVEVTPAQMESAAPATIGPCAFVWATEPQPDLTAALRAAFEAAGLQPETVAVNAFGENCLNSDNSVRSFGAMQTDFELSFQVELIDEREVIGNLAAQALTVLSKFPPDQTPGPNPGRVTLEFFTRSPIRSQQIFFIFSYTRVYEALEQNLRGAALLNILN